MKTVHNPSYGIGLAIHHYIRICDECDYAAFIPETLVKQHKESHMRHAGQPNKAARKSWFGRRKK